MPTPSLESTARPTPRALAVAIAAPLIVTALKLSWIDSLGRLPFLLYFVAIVVAGWLGGWIAGALATAIATGASVWLFLPLMALPVPEHTRWMRVFVFTLEALTITVLTDWLRRVRERAQRTTRETALALAKVESVLSGLNDGLTLVDRAGRVVYANAAAAKLIGYDEPPGFLSEPQPDVPSGAALRAADGALLKPEQLPSRRVLRERQSNVEELIRLQREDDPEERWLHVRASTVRLPGGEAPLALNVLHDLTEARQRDAALQMSREWFATALRSIGDAVIATDASGVVTFLNPPAEQLTGWSSQEAAGKPVGDVFEIYDEGSRRTLESPVARVLREGRVVGALANHTLLRGRHGAVVCIDDSAAPIRDERGEVAGVVMVFRDVTGKRADERERAFLGEATRELNSSLDYRRTLRSVAQLAVPAIADWCVVDLWEGEQLVRLAAEHVEPDKRELLFEMDRRWPLNRQMPNGRAEALRGDRPTMRNAVRDDELHELTQNDEHLALLRIVKLSSFLLVPLRAQGVTIGLISLVMTSSARSFSERDLKLATELAERAGLAAAHAQAYERAEQARREAEEASRTKDDFLAMLGHELRNPLAPIVTAVHLMKMRRADLFERERTIIERQVRHLTTLVDDLLDVSRITRGKVELRKEAVELNETVARALELSAPLIEQRRHQVEVSLPPVLRVDGDPVRLSQVVANLLTNAAKYTPVGGHIEIHGALEPEHVVISVRDDGAGIEPELLPRVFELFVQGRQGIDRRQGGLGLGLAIVRSVVELHGGEVSARSEGLGHGSEFTLRLPRGALRRHSSIPAPAPVPQHAPGERPRVLIVDDNGDALHMLADALRAHGHEVHTAEDPVSALTLAEQLPPRIALLDIGLPGIDGYELARRLRQLPGSEAVKLIAVTGYGQTSDRKRTQAAGFDDHLVKPVSLPELHRAVDRLS